MKTEQFQEFDPSLKRTIVRDFENSSLTIIGDFSSSSVTTFWVVDKFNPDIPYAIFIRRQSALRQMDYLNKKFKTNIFTITNRTIFV